MKWKKSKFQIHVVQEPEVGLVRTLESQAFANYAQRGCFGKLCVVFGMCDCCFNQAGRTHS